MCGVRGARDGGWLPGIVGMALVLVSGANGFVGQALCHALTEAGYTVRGAVRRLGRIPFPSKWAPTDCECVAVGDSGPEWSVLRRLKGWTFSCTLPQECT